MDLPLEFPSDVEVIAEEVARFRALSTEQRMRVIREIFEAGAMMMRHSPNAAYLRQYALEQKELERQAIRDIIARHGG